MPVLMEVLIYCRPDNLKKVPNEDLQFLDAAQILRYRRKSRQFGHSGFIFGFGQEIIPSAPGMMSPNHLLLDFQQSAKPFGILGMCLDHAFPFLCPKDQFGFPQGNRQTFFNVQARPPRPTTRFWRGPDEPVRWFRLVRGNREN